MKKIIDCTNCEISVVEEKLDALREANKITPDAEKTLANSIWKMSKDNGKIGRKVLAYIPIYLLHIPSEYQRIMTFDICHADDIARNFDINAMDPIKLSFRSGRLYIIDGGHRVYASITNGNEYIEAEVSEMTFEEEVSLFIGQHKEKKLSPYDIFNAGLSIGLKTDVALKEICDKYQVAIVPKARRNTIGELKSITNAKRIIECSGVECLDWIFDIIKKCKWEEEPSAYSGQILKLLNTMYNIYIDIPKLASGFIVDILKNQTPVLLLSSAVTAYPTRGQSSAMRIYLEEQVNRRMEEFEKQIKPAKIRLA